MSLPMKMCLGCAGAAGVSGAGYLGYKLLPQKETFKSKYSLAVDGFLSNRTIIDKKLGILKEADSNPKNEDLKIAKQKKKDSRDEEARTAFEKGCKAIHEEPTDSQYLDDFKKYCSFNNGDKIVSGKSLVSEKANFDNHWNSFNGKTLDGLQKGFVEIHKSKKDAADDSWKEKMLGECKRLSDEIFEGEIPNFNDYCTKDGR
ncbi:hypothetical protein MHF_0463 [Mycoplasma haemofelis Ohio2]|uniref:Uncharacterized protein n=1 Tax=Mycoplasma haemofelis (strain Ohio2) TaxID=859194 RepID=F6FHK0_MYCHI|nr:hypothetical protein MHF_0463 [Mycoplasma haemofelis Ohio2]